MTTNDPVPNALEASGVGRATTHEPQRAGVTGLLLAWTSLGCGFAAVSSCQALLRWLLP